MGLAKSFIMGGWTVVWNLIVRKKFIESQNLYFNPRIKYGEDFVFLINAIIASDKVWHVVKPLYYYNRINENSALKSKHFDYYEHVVAAIVAVRDFANLHYIDLELQNMLDWKMIWAKQDLVLYPDMHKEFLALYPECHQYIQSCPWIGKKMKVLMWLMTHHMGLLVKAFDYLRFLKIGSAQKY